MDNGPMDNGPMDRPKAEECAPVGGPVGGPPWLEEGEEGPKADAEVAEVAEVANRVVRSIGVNAWND